jgi:DNA adenine methylase
MSLFKTPLRYPGGKQRLAPFLTEVLIENKLIGGDYVEPFAGGAGAAIELLLTKKVSNIHLNDSSIAIYSFWNSILNETEKFCRMITSASLSVNEWRRQREILINPQQHSQLEVGFSAFYLNRCNRSGVITGGVIGGLEQDGEWKMDARFSRIDLITRIEAIAYYKSHIHISNNDAEVYIEEYIPTTPLNTLVYCDPPYYTKSKDLYLNDYKKEDHQRLAKTIQKRINRKWLLSYDATRDIISYYSNRNHFLYDLQYHAATVYKGKEIFIFSDKLKLPKDSSLSFISRPLKNLRRRLHKA